MVAPDADGGQIVVAKCPRVLPNSCAASLSCALQLQAAPNFTYSATPAYLAQMGSKTRGDALPSVPQLEIGHGLALKAGPPGGAGLAGMGGAMALGAGGGLSMPVEQQASQLVQNSLRTASGELGAPLTYPASSLAQLQQMLQVTGAAHNCMPQ